MSPQDKKATERVVAAGVKVMFDPKTHSILQEGLKSDMPMPEKLATEAVGLVKLLQDKAGGKIPRSVLLPSAVMLMAEIARWMKDTDQGAPTPEDIKAAYPILVDLIKKTFSNAGAAPQGQTPAAPPAPPVSAAPAPGILGAQ